MKKVFIFTVLVTFFVGCAGASMAATWKIGKKGDFTTIQSAINSYKVNPGDTLKLLPGNFKGALLTKPLIITGQDSKTVINDGPSNAGAKGLKIGFELYGNAAKGSKIMNMTFTVHLPIYSMKTSNITLSGLTLKKPVQGITNWGGSNWVITKNRIIDLTTRVLPNNSLSAGGIGILIGDRFNRVVQNNKITKNTIKGTLRVPKSDPGGHAGSFITLYADFRDPYMGASLLTKNVIGGASADGNKIGSLVSSAPDKIPVHGIGFSEAPSQAEHVIIGNTAKNNVLKIATKVQFNPEELKQLNPNVQTTLGPEFDISDADLGEDGSTSAIGFVNPL